MRRSITRKESQVSKDFNATLKKVVHFSTITDSKEEGSNSNYKYNSVSNDQLLKLSTNQSLNSDDISKFRALKRSSTLNHETNGWRSLNSVLSDKNAENEFIELAQDQNTKVPDEPIKTDTIKDSSTKLLKRNNSSTTQKNNKKLFIKNLFFNEKSFSPFESTDVTDLSFNLTIIVENGENILLQVYNHYNIKKVINKIASKRSLKIDEISLVYQKVRLQRNITLSWYKINSKSKVYLKILEKVKFIGQYLTKHYPIFIYTSETINDIKILFSKEINVDEEFLELKYKEVFLHDNKDFSLYDIPEGSTINILKKTSSISAESPENISYDKSPGFELSQTFQTMTNRLQKCNCNERRYTAMACCLLSHFDSNIEKHNCLKLLSEFGSDYHHKSCFKSNSKRRPSVGKIDDDHNSEISAAEVSLNENIHEEIERIRKDRKIIIENSDLDYLYHTKSFRAFKRFLKDKIGTKPNLSSLSMLYHYAQSLVMYINPKENNDEAVQRILKFIKQYFLKYYEKPIIAKGGLTNLTITESKNNET